MVAFFEHKPLASAADRRERIVANFTACDVRSMLVEQADQHADQFGFCLASKAEQNEVMPRKQRVHQLRNHGFFVSYDSGKQRLLLFQFADQVCAQLVFD